MNNLHRGVAAAVTLSVAVAAAYWFGSRGSPSASAGSTLGREQPATAEGVSVSTRAGQDAPGKLKTAEDQQLREALLRGALLGGQPDAPQVDVATRSCEKLDARMAEAPPNPEQTARMERILQSIVDSGALVKTRASFVCGASMCRLQLESETEADAQRAVMATIDRKTKLFASTLVFPKAEGTRSVYVATNGADLTLEPSTGPIEVIRADGAPAER